VAALGLVNVTVETFVAWEERRTLFSVRSFGPHRTSGLSDLVVQYQAPTPA